MRRKRLGSTFSDLNSNSFSSLAAAKRENFSAAFGGASLAEAVDAGAMDNARLPGALGHNLIINYQLSIINYQLLDLVIVPRSFCFGFFGS